MVKKNQYYIIHLNEFVELATQHIESITILM